MNSKSLAICTFLCQGLWPDHEIWHFWEMFSGPWSLPFGMWQVVTKVHDSFGYCNAYLFKTDNLISILMTELTGDLFKMFNSGSLTRCHNLMLSLTKLWQESLVWMSMVWVECHNMITESYVGHLKTATFSFKTKIFGGWGQIDKHSKLNQIISWPLDVLPVLPANFTASF